MKRTTNTIISISNMRIARVLACVFAGVSALSLNSDQFDDAIQPARNEEESARNNNIKSAVSLKKDEANVEGGPATRFLSAVKNFGFAQRVLYPLFMGDAESSHKDLVKVHKLKSKFWGATMVALLAYMALDDIPNPFMALPTFIFTASLMNNIFLLFKPTSRMTMSRGIEYLYSYFVNGGIDEPGWYRKPPHCNWNNILRLPVARNGNEAGIVTEEITRLVRGHLIELTFDGFDDEIMTLPPSLENSYFGKVISEGKVIGEVVRIGTRNEPPLVRVIDPWEMADEKDKEIIGFDDRFWSEEELRKLNMFVRANHISEHYRNDKSKKLYPWKQGLGVMIFPFLFCWWGFLTAFSFTSMVYDSTRLPGATGSAFRILMKHPILSPILSLIAVLFTTELMDNLGIDRRHHESAVKEVFHEIYTNMKMKQPDVHNSNNNQIQPAAAENNDDILKLVTTAQVNHEQIWPKVSLLFVKKENLKKYKMQDCDNTIEDASEDLFSVRKDFEPPSANGFVRVKVTKGVLGAVFPHGLVCTNPVTALQFAETMDTLDARMLVADPMFSVPGASLYLWMKQFDRAGRERYQELCNSETGENSGNVLVYPGGFDEAPIPEGTIWMADKAKAGFLAYLWSIVYGKDEENAKLVKAKGVQWVCGISVQNDRSYYGNMLDFLGLWLLSKIAKWRVVPTALPCPIVNERCPSLFRAAVVLGIPVLGSLYSVMFSVPHLPELQRFAVNFAIREAVVLAVALKAWDKFGDDELWKFIRDFLRACAMVPPETGTGSVIIGKPIPMPDEDEFEIENSAGLSHAEQKAKAKGPRGERVAKMFHELRGSLEQMHNVWSPIHKPGEQKNRPPKPLRFAGAKSKWRRDEDDGNWIPVNNLETTNEFVRALEAKLCPQRSSSVEMLEFSDGSREKGEIEKAADSFAESIDETLLPVLEAVKDMATDMPQA